MTKAEQVRITAWRLRILQHAEGEPRQVAQTCRYFGICRTAFYRWKRRYDKHGGAGLADRIYKKANELGGSDEGGPGLRPEGGEFFYAAYFRDLDGNKLDVFSYG